MDFITILMRFGLNPADFENRYFEPVQIYQGNIYQVYQADIDRICPFCKSKEVTIKGYYFTETRCSQTHHFTDILQIRRIRYKCKSCNKTYSPSLHGIDRNCRISNQVKTFINYDFTREVKGFKYTNAIAECINNKLKTILKSAYGYHNFERFRKRALLICTYTRFR